MHLHLLQAGEASVVAARERSRAAVGAENLHTHGTRRDFIVQGLRRRALIRQQHVGGDTQGRRSRDETRRDERVQKSKSGMARTPKFISLRQGIIGTSW